MRALERIKGLARSLKRELAALHIAGRDARTPRAAKVAALAVVAYALSPIDLIPDFIPVLGYLDDLIILPAGIALAVRLVPADLMTGFRAQAREIELRKCSKAGAAIVAGIWIIAAVAAYWWIWRG